MRVLIMCLLRANYVESHSFTS